MATPLPGGILSAESGTQYANEARDYFRASDGSRYGYLGGTSPNVVSYTFQTPISQFGAYWGHYTGGSWPDPAVIHVSFLDVCGTEVGTAEFTYSGAAEGALEWHGWRMPVPIQQINVTSLNFLIMDGLQVGDGAGP